MFVGKNLCRLTIAQLELNVRLRKLDVVGDFGPECEWRRTFLAAGSTRWYDRGGGAANR